MANEVIVSESGLGPFTQTIEIGPHILVADEPVAAGGNDAGPSPYDFLLTALGSCTSMTMRLYATKKNLPLVKVIVRLSHKKVYAQDCADCDDTEKQSNARLDQIERKIELIGNLSVEERQKLLTIANACPIHRTLTTTVKIKTELMEETTSS